MAENDSTVRPGQIWANNDPRMAGHTVRILEIRPSLLPKAGPVAVCRIETVARNVSKDRVGKTTKIRVSRFRPGRRGYRKLSG